MAPGKFGVSGQRIDDLLTSRLHFDNSSEAFSIAGNGYKHVDTGRPLCPSDRPRTSNFDRDIDIVDTLWPLPFRSQGFKQSAGTVLIGLEQQELLEATANLRLEHPEPGNALRPQGMTAFPVAHECEQIALATSLSFAQQSQTIGSRKRIFSDMPF